MTEIVAPLLVRDLMSVGVETCEPDTPIQEIAHLFTQKGLEAVVVLEGGHALGVVGQDEIVQAYATGNFHLRTAREVMREGVPQIPPDIPLTTAAQLMLDLKVRVLFLMHHASGVEYPAAYISYRHFLRHMEARNADDLKDLGIYANRQSPIQSYLQRREAKRSRNVFALNSNTSEQE